MTEQWTKARPELENVSLNVYNRTLGKDLSYTGYLADLTM